jgi:RNA recognition motif-containing protein
MPGNISKKRIQELFQPFGAVVKVDFSKRKTNNPVIFVHVENGDVAAAAIEALNKTQLEGKTIAVSVYQEEEIAVEARQDKKEKLVKAKQYNKKKTTELIETEKLLNKDAGPSKWSDLMEVELVKGVTGLGFSIRNIPDPDDPSKVVITVDHLVKDGVAAKHGVLESGDQLVSMNEITLANTSFEFAVTHLIQAADGLIRFGVRKPRQPDEEEKKPVMEAAAGNASNYRPL